MYAMRALSGVFSGYSSGATHTRITYSKAKTDAIMYSNMCMPLRTPSEIGKVSKMMKTTDATISSIVKMSYIRAILSPSFSWYSIS